MTRILAYFLSDVLFDQTVRHVKMLDGVTVAESKAQKDELILVGNDIDNVSQSGLSIIKCSVL
jgi:large subunit ribosomal protein L9e